MVGSAVNSNSKMPEFFVTAVDVKDVKWGRGDVMIKYDAYKTHGESFFNFIAEGPTAAVSPPIKDIKTINAWFGDRNGNKFIALMEKECKQYGITAGGDFQFYMREVEDGTDEYQWKLSGKLSYDPRSPEKRHVKSAEVVLAIIKNVIMTEGGDQISIVQVEKVEGLLADVEMSDSKLQLKQKPTFAQGTPPKGLKSSSLAVSNNPIFETRKQELPASTSSMILEHCKGWAGAVAVTIILFCFKNRHRMED